MRSLLGVLVLGLMVASPALARPGAAPIADLSPPQASDDLDGFVADALASDLAAPNEKPAPVRGPHPSGVARQLADWVAVSGDNHNLSYLIVDKQAADAFAFDADGHLIGSAPILVGLAKGDDSAPGVGEMKLGAIAPDERTTPAGRFMAEFGGSDGHGTVLWVDYPNSISLHPVITTNPAEHRLRRIKSASPAQHRISFGCINVPAKFYADVVQKAFAEGGVVYILPDTKSVAEVFPEFAAATEIAQGDAPKQKTVRCDAPLAELPDHLPDPQPELSCPLVHAESVTDATPASPAL